MMLRVSNPIPARPDIRARSLAFDCGRMLEAETSAPQTIMQMVMRHKTVGLCSSYRPPEKIGSPQFATKDGRLPNRRLVTRQGE
jgi:hypothetical protein